MTSHAEVKGKVILITGGNTGIGYATAKQLCSLGGHVYIACRDVAKGQAAARSITGATSGKCEVLSLDLADLTSVKACAEEVLRKCDRLDVLINNAGLNVPGVHPSGLQYLFVVNYLSHFYLYTLLEPLLMKCSGRVVNLSSVMHHFGSDICHLHNSARNKHPPHDPRRSYYADSKLYLTLLTLSINQRGAGHVSSIAVNPGAVRSDIWRAVPFPLSLLYDVFMRACYLEPHEGCATSVYAALVDIREYERYMHRKKQTQSASDTCLHQQLPYVVPYKVFSGCLIFEMIAAFAGPQWAAVTLPGKPQEAAAILWDFSSSLIEEDIISKSRT